MKIVVGSDHAGFELKEKIKAKLIAEGYEVTDVGTDSAESVDYPIYGHALAHEVADGRADRGIAVCGSGIGISIACNKVKGIRCALCTSLEMAEMSRRHNNANVLALGGRMTDHDLAMEIVNKWLNTDFEGGKHLRRINMLEDE